MTGIRADLSGFDTVAEAFRDADKVVRRRMSKALRDVAKPVGTDVIRKGAARLPHRGGLAARVATRGRVSATMSSGSSPRATLSLTNREGIKLAGLDAGVVRRPLFGIRSAWFSQDIPDGVFSEAFESVSTVAKVRDEALSAMQAALVEIAGDARH